MNKYHQLRHAVPSSIALVLAMTAVGSAQAATDDVAGVETSNAESADQSDAYDGEEIMVIARRRQESSMAVPVILTTVSAEQIERMGTNDLKDLGRLVPGMTMGHSLLSVGAQISMRGVGTISSDAGIDQSVSLNVDGLQLTQGLSFFSAMFDTASVEAMRGPQALFFGKSSPGGVIAIRTADPANEFEIKGRAGYEANARERVGELIVSGPLTDTFGVRLAGRLSAADGYFRNNAIVAPNTGALAPDDRAPNSKGYLFRATALWNPSDNFEARLKVNLTGDRTIAAEASQLSSCPEGTESPSGIPFISPDEDCKLDRNMRMVYMDPAAFPGISHGGVPWLRTRQHYGTLEMSYNPADDVTLTSTTAYYKLHSLALANGHISTEAGPTLAIDNDFYRRDFTQEVRLVTDFDAPVNFTLGGYFQDSGFGNHVTQYTNQAIPAIADMGRPILADGEIDIDIRTYSFFGQARWELTPELEIAGGLRWTDETRTAEAVNLLPTTPVMLRPIDPRINSENLAPEFTVTYRPSDDFTVFGALKVGQKSGSYNVSTVPVGPGNTIDNAFGDEEVKGGEVGFKVRAFDRQLRVNVGGYRYTYTGLQVGASEPQGLGNAPRIRTVNAGKARVTGVEMDAAFNPRSIEGLTLRGAINWNKAKFIELNNIPCYGGQTIALGCNQVYNPVTDRFTAQDMSGTPMVRAPLWQGNFGFDYELPVGNDMNLILSNNNQYSSRYVTFLGLRDDRYQDKFIKSDVSLTLQGPQERWELALIGKNLTDQITAGSCSASNRANGLLLGGNISGQETTGAAGLDEVGCYVDRGRELWVRASFRL